MSELTLQESVEGEEEEEEELEVEDTLEQGVPSPFLSVS